MFVEKLLLVSNITLLAVYVYMYVKNRKLATELYMSKLATRVAVEALKDRTKHDELSQHARTTNTTSL
jgi:hypothetical protein